MTTGKEYMHASHHSTQPVSAQSQGAPQPALELPIPAGSTVIALPSPSEFTLPSVDLAGLIEKRRTLRKYADKAITLQELSFFLWASQGVERVTDRPVTMRTVPSAGARHAFESYLLVNRVSGLQPGLYRYAALSHSLVEITLNPEVNAILTHACLDQNQVTTSRGNFLLGGGIGADVLALQ